MTQEIKSVELPTGVTLQYVEQGDPSGVPLLLLHGFAGSWRSFEPVLPHLPATMHAFVLTQRGHGDASHPVGGYQLRDFAADVAAFMDVLDLEAAVIAGHSMGSAVAQRFAMDYPEKTLGLVLVGAGGVSPANPAAQAFYDSTVSRLTDPIDPEFVHKFLEGTLAQPIPQAVFETMVEEARKVPARVWKAAFRARLDENFSGEFTRIQVPTLIVWGDQDARYPRREQEALAAAIANSRLVVYPGAGHELHSEEPERFASDLATFIEDLVS